MSVCDYCMPGNCPCDDRRAAIVAECMRAITARECAGGPSLYQDGACCFRHSMAEATAERMVKILRLEDEQWNF